MVTTARWVTGNLYSFLYLRVYLAGQYSGGQVSFSSSPSASPFLGDPCLYLPSTHTHSPSSACSPSGRYINKRREKVTQLAGTEPSLTRVQMNALRRGRGALLHQALSTCELFLIPTRPAGHLPWERSKPGGSRYNHCPAALHAHTAWPLPCCARSPAVLQRLGEGRELGSKPPPCPTLRAQ